MSQVRFYGKWVSCLDDTYSLVDVHRMHTGEKIRVTRDELVDAMMALWQQLTEEDKAGFLNRAKQVG